MNYPVLQGEAHLMEGAEYDMSICRRHDDDPTCRRRGLSAKFVCLLPLSRRSWRTRDFQSFFLPVLSFPNCPALWQRKEGRKRSLGPEKWASLVLGLLASSAQ